METELCFMPQLIQSPVSKHWLWAPYLLFIFLRTFTALSRIPQPIMWLTSCLMWSFRSYLWPQHQIRVQLSVQSSRNGAYATLIGVLVSALFDSAYGFTSLASRVLLTGLIPLTLMKPFWPGVTQEALSTLSTSTRPILPSSSVPQPPLVKNRVSPYDHQWPLFCCLHVDPLAVARSLWWSPLGGEVLIIELIGLYDCQMHDMLDWVLFLWQRKMSLFWYIILAKGFRSHTIIMWYICCALASISCSVVLCQMIKRLTCFLLHAFVHLRDLLECAAQRRDQKEIQECEVHKASRPHWVGQTRSVIVHINCC